MTVNGIVKPLSYALICNNSYGSFGALQVRFGMFLTLFLAGLVIEVFIVNGTDSKFGIRSRKRIWDALASSSSKCSCHK